MDIHRDDRHAQGFLHRVFDRALNVLSHRSNARAVLNYYIQVNCNKVITDLNVDASPVTGRGARPRRG